MTWNRYHEGVAEALGAPPPVFVHIPTDVLLKIVPERAASVADNFQFNNIFDNTAARTDLGFRYTISWIEGVKRAVTWLEQNRKSAPQEAAVIDDRIIQAWRDMQTSLVQAFQNIDGKSQ